MSNQAVPVQFANPVHETQQTFRALLSAMSQPGRIQRLPLPPAAPASFSPALCSIALTLFDDTVSVWLDPSLASDEVLLYLRFHTGVAVVEDKSAATFAIIHDIAEFEDFQTFSSGQSSYPDRSVTVIIQLPSLDGGQEIILSGPGIDQEISVAPAGLPGAFWHQWNSNTACYPCGIDLFLTDGTSIMGLPRTTKARI